MLGVRQAREWLLYEEMSFHLLDPPPAASQQQHAHHHQPTKTTALHHCSQTGTVVPSHPQLPHSPKGGMQTASILLHPRSSAPRAVSRSGRRSAPLARMLAVLTGGTFVVARKVPAPAAAAGLPLGYRRTPVAPMAQLSQCKGDRPA